ncbi:MAG: type II secretion system F family protein [Phycisphaerae bacterium]|jgi:type II secretory pathway component PulF
MILTYEAIAAERLRRRGLYVTRITKGGDVDGRSQVAADSRKDLRFSLKTLTLFTRQMAMLLRAGSSVVDAMTAIKRQMTKPGHIALLSRIVTDLEEGSTLTDALRRHPQTFGPVYCAVVAAGEASATLDEMFERLATMVRKTRATRNKVIGALTYPALLICMSCSIFLVLLFFVLPRFNGMFVQLGVDPPVSTKVLLSTADLLTAYWPIALGGSAACVLGIVMILMTPMGRQWLANVQVRVPVFGNLRSRLIQAQVFRTMGMLLGARIGVLETLDLVRLSTRNDRFQNLFSEIETAVTSGGELSTAFEQCRFIEPYITQAVHTGEHAGNLGGAISYCADMLDETNQELIDAVMKLVEPLILIGMGVVVGGVAISLFMPLFDMTSAMQ